MQSSTSHTNHYRTYHNNGRPNRSPDNRTLSITSLLQEGCLSPVRYLPTCIPCIASQCIHHTHTRSLDEFAAPRLPPHLQIYTWQSCTVSELTHLLITALPSLLPSEYAGTRIAYRLIFPDMNAPSRPGTLPRYIARDLGSVVVGATGVDSLSNDLGDRGGVKEEEKEQDEEKTAENAKEALKQLTGELSKTLLDARFVIGDYISAAILPPLADGSVQDVPPPPAGPSARGPPPREPMNGYGGRGGDFDRFGGGRGGRGGGRFEERRGGGAFPQGEWRRGEAPPAEERETHWRGGSGPGYGGGGGRGRGRGRERW